MRNKVRGKPVKPARKPLIIDAVAKRVKDPYDVNPKDALAAAKVPLDLVPDSITYWASFGFLEGAHKYGQYNWRAKPVRISVYSAALKRHAMRLNAGEWADPKTKVPHISSILACAAIIGDAELSKTLIDDRPPAQPNLLKALDDSGPLIAHLAEFFKDHNPHQYTIKDNIKIRK